jgi:tetratricopeptide (TPR) repeat protein
MKTKLDRAVNRFLKYGVISDFSTNELAAACDRKVRNETQLSTESSIKLGRQFVKHAKPKGGLLYRTALRALAWSLLVAGNYREAKKTYLAARRLLAKDAISRARIDRVLIDVYMYLGDFKEAQRRARMALATFGRLGAQGDAAKTRVNYANLLHRQDRHRQAKQLYEQATSFFEGEGADVAVALCHYNLANTLVQLMEFEEAGRLYGGARKVFQTHNSALHATGCLYGLAWLHMLEGNFHTALQELTKCEQEYDRGKQRRERILCKLDRAEVYLGLNLVVDARQTAREAARAARKLGLSYEQAKGDFFYGKASAAMGRNSEARGSLRRAQQGFLKDQNQGFAGAAQLTLAQLQRPSPARLDQMRLARKRFTQAQLPLWEAICDLKILAVHPDEKIALRRLSRNRAVATVPHLRARRLALLGDREAGRQRMKAAVRHWSKAADVLDAVRAKLPPIELRSAFLKDQSDPYRNLIETHHKSDPPTAAVWSERFKTVGLWSSIEDVYVTDPARQKAEDSLAQLAGQVTAMSQIISDKSERRTPGRLHHRVGFAKLQQTVRHNLALLETGQGARANAPEELARLFDVTSCAHPIVQFHVGRRDIFAFVHHNGTCRSHRYLDGVRIARDLIALWRFLVERADSAKHKPRKNELADECDILRRLGGWILPPLQLPSDARRLLILPEGQLSCLPWAALTANGIPLLERCEISFAPSLRHHLKAQQQTTRSKKTKIFVGQADGLTHIQREVAAVSSRLQGRNTTVNDPCYRADWPDHESAKIWHYTGHAHLRPDNPFYSSLLLADGPLFAADFRLKRNRVELITLAACRTGQQTSLPGEEAGGMVRSLLEMGARNVIASHWAVSDFSTSEWTDLLYKSYMGGMSASSAARHAALGVREKFPSAYHWSAFSVFGAG